MVRPYGILDVGMLTSEEVMFFKVVALGNVEYQTTFSRPFKKLKQSIERLFLII